MRALLCRGIIALAAPLAHSTRAQPINPIVREGVTETISAHVYVIPDGSVPLVPNVGIIVGTRATPMTKKPAPAPAPTPQEERPCLKGR